MAKSTNKKILILCNSDIGLYKFRQELIERLIKEGYLVYIVLPNGDFINNLTDLGCRFIEIEFDRHGKNIIQDFVLFVKYFKSIWGYSL